MQDRYDTEHRRMQDRDREREREWDREPEYSYRREFRDRPERESSFQRRREGDEFYMGGQRSGRESMGWGYEGGRQGRYEGESNYGRNYGQDYGSDYGSEGRFRQPWRESGREYGMGYGRGQQYGQGQEYGPGQRFENEGYSQGWGQNLGSEGRYSNQGRESWRSGQFGGSDWGRERESDYGRGRSWSDQSRGTSRGFSGGISNYGGGLSEYGERGRFFGRGPKGYQRADERIREDICERLTQNPDVDASDIEIRVSNGEVTLTGSVDERHCKRIAEEVAENVSGVKDVHNQIRVQTHQTVGVGQGSQSGQTTGQTTGSKK